MTGNAGSMQGRFSGGIEAQDKEGKTDEVFSLMQQKKRSG